MMQGKDWTVFWLTSSPATVVEGEYGRKETLISVN